MRSKLLCTALLAAAPLTAQAHVVLSEQQARPGAPYNAHFKVGHGCDGSPTTALTITMPDGVSAVMPQEKPGWSAKIARDGSNRTVNFSGGRLAGDMPGEFVVTMTLPAKEGPLAFPVLQTCEKGSENWSEIPAAAGHKLESPAPVLTLTKTPVNKDGGMNMAGMNMPGMAVSGGIGKAAPAGVTVKDAWIRALPGTSGGYFTLHNGGSKQVVLTGADSTGCGMLMIHKSEDKGGMSSMSHVSEVPVAAGADVEFTPGSFHLMCMDTKPSIKPGATVPVTLSFKDGGQLTTQFPVRNAAGK